MAIRPIAAAPPLFVAADSPTGFVNPAGYHPCQGLWYTPSDTHRLHLGDALAHSLGPTIGVIATHYNVDFSEHYLADYLCHHGFGFLGWNTRYRGAEGWFILEHALVDIGAGVTWLREVAHVDSVVLLGNSGGGSLMAAYQAQATEPHIGPTRGNALPPAVESLPPADLYVSLQAHTGRPEVLTSWLDPSVTDENDPLSVDPELDMYNPRNGPPYPPDFLERYRDAQRARNDRITAWAIAELERCAAAGGYDRNFCVARAWADPRFLDPTIDPSDRPTGVCYLGNPRWANYSPFSIGASNTLRTWLSMWSLSESHCVGTPHLARITVPSLVIQSAADTGVFPGDARAIFDALGSVDKTLEMVSGDHYLETPDDARLGVASIIAEWVRART